MKQSPDVDELLALLAKQDEMLVALANELEICKAEVNNGRQMGMSSTTYEKVLRMQELCSFIFSKCGFSEVKFFYEIMSKFSYTVSQILKLIHLFSEKR